MEKKYNFECIREPFEDILCRKADVFVIPDTPVHGPYAPMCARLYQKAGYLETETERSLFFADSELFSELFYPVTENPGIAFTSGGDLGASDIIHVELNIEVCFGEMTEEQKKKINAFYDMGLYFGFSSPISPDAHARSVIIPLIFGNVNSYSPSDAEYDAECFARKAIEDFMKKNPQFNAPEYTVYLAAPWEYCPPYVERAPEGVRLPVTNFTDMYEEYEWKLQSDMKIITEMKKISESEYGRHSIYKMLSRIENSERLADEINYDKGSISKFRNGKLKKPRKNRLIAIAVGAGLSDYERYKLIRLCGYSYPEDEMDKLVEKLLHSGIRDFSSVNKKLCEIDPKFALDNTDAEDIKEK